MDATVGLIYIMRAGDRVKIGWCTGDVQRRRAELQTGCPELLEILVTFPGTRADEATLYSDFTALRGVGEWFRYEEPLVGFVMRKSQPDRTTNRRAPSSAFIECTVAVGPGAEDPNPFHLSLPKEHRAFLSIRPIPWDRRDAERLHYSKASPLEPSEFEPIPGPGRDVLLIIHVPDVDVPQIAIRLEPREIDLLVQTLGGECSPSLAGALTSA